MCVCVCVCKEGRYSAVGRATRYGLDDPGIKCRWGRDRLRGKPRILHNGYLVFPEAKRPARGADDPLPSSAALRIGWNYKSLRVDLEACHGLIHIVYI